MRLMNKTRVQIEEDRYEKIMFLNLKKYVSSNLNNVINNAIENILSNCELVYY